MAARLTAVGSRRRLPEDIRNTLVGAVVIGILAALFVLSAVRDGGAIGSYTVSASFASAEHVRGHGDDLRLEFRRARP